MGSLWNKNFLDASTAISLFHQAKRVTSKQSPSPVTVFLTLYWITQIETFQMNNVNNFHPLGPIVWEKIALIMNNLYCSNLQIYKRPSKVTSRGTS